MRAVHIVAPLGSRWVSSLGTHTLTLTHDNALLSSPKNKAMGRHGRVLEVGTQFGAVSIHEYPSE